MSSEPYYFIYSYLTDRDFDGEYIEEDSVDFVLVSEYFGFDFDSFWETEI